MSVNIYDGFSLLSADLAALEKVSDDRTIKAALHEGGEIVTEAVKAAIHPHWRTGKLEKSIMHTYDPGSKTEKIGWGGEFARDGFYGKMMETGFTTRGVGRANGGKAPRYIDQPAPHMRPGYEQSKNAAADAMMAILRAAAK